MLGFELDRRRFVNFMCVKQFPQRFGSSRHVCVRPRNLHLEYTSTDGGDMQTPVKIALHCQFIVGYGSCISRTVKGTGQWSSNAQRVLDEVA